MTSEFRIAHDHPSLPGHFPGRPLVPGVVVLDRVLAAIEAAHGQPLGILTLPQVKFMQPLLPGETATIELDTLELDTIEGDGQPPRWRFRVLRGRELLASGECIGA